MALGGSSRFLFLFVEQVMTPTENCKLILQWRETHLQSGQWVHFHNECKGAGDPEETQKLPGREEFQCEAWGMEKASTLRVGPGY